MPSPWSADRQPRPAGRAGRSPSRAGHRHDSPCGRAVLDRVVDQVLEHLRQLVAVAAAPAAAPAASSSAMRHLARGGAQLAGRAPPPHQRRRGRPAGRAAGARSARCATATADRRPAGVMRSACSAMMPRKRSRASASSRAGPSRVSMKPDHARQRRLELVARHWRRNRRASARLRFSAVTSCSVRSPRCRRAPGRDRVLRRAARSSHATPALPAPTTTNSTLRAVSPASTASAAASSAGLRSAPARSRGSATDPMNSAAAVLARTMRRCGRLGSVGPAPQI